MKQIVVYVHGKGGSAEEAEHYKFLFPALITVRRPRGRPGRNFHSFLLPSAHAAGGSR